MKKVLVLASVLFALIMSASVSLAAGTGLIDLTITDAITGEGVIGEGGIQLRRYDRHDQDWSYYAEQRVLSGQSTFSFEVPVGKFQIAVWNNNYQDYQSKTVAVSAGAKVNITAALKRNSVIITNGKMTAQVPADGGQVKITADVYTTASNVVVWPIVIASNCDKKGCRFSESQPVVAQAPVNGKISFTFTLEKGDPNWEYGVDIFAGIGCPLNPAMEEEYYVGRFTKGEPPAAAAEALDQYYAAKKAKKQQMKK